MKGEGLWSKEQKDEMKISMYCAYEKLEGHCLKHSFFLQKNHLTVKVYYNILVQN